MRVTYICTQPELSSIVSRGHMHPVQQGVPRWVRTTTSAATQATRLLCLLSWVYSVCVLFTLLFQQHNVVRHVRSYVYIHPSVVCGVLRRSLQEQDSVIPRTPKLHSENMNIPSQLPHRLRLRIRLRLPRNTCS